MSNNFTQKAENALNRSVNLAEEFGHTYIGTEHVLLALAEDEDSTASVMMKKHKITTEKLCFAIKEYSGVGSQTKLMSKDTTPKCRKLLEISYKIAKKNSSEKIGTEHLLLAILDERECVAAKILSKIDADVIGLKESLSVYLRSLGRAALNAEPVSESAIPNLLKYGKNITALAERGELDPVIGRDEETDRVIRILLRKTKNNPCLIGEAGVGKTAIVEGLAERIAEGRVPESLRNKKIFSVDLTSMVAGAKYRGDFEERIKNIMAEASKNKSIILFIDEIHTIVGAGAAEGAIDAANIMKPDLSRGDIQLIGATTLAEYRKYIEKDAALERRFQPVIVEEPSVERTIEILKGLKYGLERHHNVYITDEAISAAATLSERYIQDRFLPDKSIDLLDEACALASTSSIVENHKTSKIRENIRQTAIKRKNAINNREYELAISLREAEKAYADELKLCLGNGEKNTPIKSVSKDHVISIIKEITGIDHSVQNDRNGHSIFDRLSSSIVGQNDAVERLSSAVKRSFAGLNSPTKPRGIFLFLGESGVGKTALALALTKELFSCSDALIRYDFSEYSEPSAVTKLLGASPGYVGYDDQISPLEKVRKHPYSVVLLDEIEKAHPDVLSLFLGVFDNGFITDASGRKISFRNTYIIMTSNIGSDFLKNQKKTGFIQGNNDADIQKKLRGYFKNEFINRIDEIILFSSLSAEDLKEIAKIKISEMNERLTTVGINLLIDKEIYDVLSKKVLLDNGFGARPLNRLIISDIENKIATMLVEEIITPGDTIILTHHGNEILCLKQNYALSK